MTDLATLEKRVDRLETWAGPGQMGVLSDRLIRVEEGVDELRRNVGTLKRDVKTLKTDVAGLKTDVAGLKTDVAGLKTDVAGLKTDVAGLKTVQDKHTAMLSEILDRLPPKK
jgi:seryl-tRNA synthetase